MIYDVHWWFSFGSVANVIQFGQSVMGVGAINVNNSSSSVDVDVDGPPIVYEWYHYPHKVDTDDKHMLRPMRSNAVMNVIPISMLCLFCGRNLGVITIQYRNRPLSRRLVSTCKKSTLKGIATLDTVYLDQGKNRKRLWKLTLIFVLYTLQYS